MQTKTFVVTLGATTSALAHMEMIFPPPILSQFNKATINADYDYKSPMNNRTEFPCKGHLNQVILGQGQAVSQATWAPGEATSFTIEGTAIHDGGSCQASLSYNHGETFTVIHSFIGRCPSGTGDTSYAITIPSDAPTQNNVLFAWTWFNNNGRREMYMNCAVVDIAGGSSKRNIEEAQVEKRANAFSARPYLFVANIDGDSGCQTKARNDFVFPQPGPDVTGNADQKTLYNDIDEKGEACADPNGTGAGAPGPVGSDSNDATTSAAAGTSTAGTFTSIPAGVFITVEPSSSARTLSAAYTSEVATSAISSGTNSDPTGAFVAGTKCTNEGAWNCIDGTSFQRCASGVWSSVIKAADGTKCSPGIFHDLVIHESISHTAQG